MRRLLLAAVAAVAVAAPASSALAWGAFGHRIIGELGMKTLPADAPAFLRTKAAAIRVGEYSRELDRSRGAGRLHDGDRDPGHFADIDDNERMLGGPLITALPPTRKDYEVALRAANVTSWDAGYLPYAMVDGWQQLVKDFSLWRALNAAEGATRDRARKRYYQADRARREDLIIRNIGVWAHYVGDAAQPMHASTHFNGWGDGPNPRGFTNERIHAPFEEDRTMPLVIKDAARIEALIPASKPCGCNDAMPRTVSFLQDTNSKVEPLYQLWGEGGFKPGDPRGETFIETQLAIGSGQLRDFVIEAWRASAAIKIGYRPDYSIEDIASGKVDPWGDLYGKN